MAVMHRDRPQRRPIAKMKFGGRCIWEKPRVRKLRHEDGTFSEEEVMHEDWLELLSDLLLVAAFMKMSAAIGHGGPDVGIMVCTFLHFWNIYQGTSAMSTYVNRYVCNCLFRLASLALVPFGTCIMVLWTGAGPNHAPSLGYTIGFVVARIGLFSVHLTVWLAIPGASASEMSKSISYVCSSATVLTISCLDNSLYGWANALSGSCAALVEVLAVVLWLPWSPFWKPSIKAGINSGHIQARQGIAVMVALGESIIQFLEPKALPWWQVSFTIAGFLLIMSFALMWFDTQPHNIEDNVLRRSWKRFLVTMYTMPILVYSLFMLGTGFEILLAHGPSASHTDEVKHSPERRLTGSHSGTPAWSLEESLALFSISVGTACALMSWHRYSHAGLAGLREKGALRRCFLRVIWCVLQCSWFGLVLVMPVERSTMPLFLIWGHLLLNLPVVLSTLRLPTHGHHSCHEDGHDGNGHGTHHTNTAAAVASVDGGGLGADASTRSTSFLADSAQTQSQVGTPMGDDGVTPGDSISFAYDPLCFAVCDCGLESESGAAAGPGGDTWHVGGAVGGIVEANEPLAESLTSVAPNNRRETELPDRSF